MGRQYVNDGKYVWMYVGRRDLTVMEGTAERTVEA
jgi:hypothetical protein